MGITLAWLIFTMKEWRDNFMTNELLNYVIINS